MLLRTPDFGTVFEVELGIVEARNLSGELLQYKNPERPSFERFRVAFSALSLDQIQAFKQFVRQVQGEEIQLIDSENRLWTGILLDDSITIRRGRGSCNYSCSFSFEGQVT